MLNIISWSKASLNQFQKYNINKLDVESPVFFLRYAKWDVFTS